MLWQGVKKERNMISETLEIKPNAYYTLDEAATLLKVSRRTVQELSRKGQIDAIKLGRQWRFLGRNLLALGVPERAERQPFMRLSAAAFDRIWDNEEDAIYDDWRPE
jgi:excisionase family DNA binding protein